MTEQITENKSEDNKNYKYGRNSFKTFAISSSIAAILITGIIKGPNYIDKFVPKQYDETAKMLSDTTFQKYLQQRANSAEKFLNSQEKYNSRKLESYLDAIYGKNPLE